MGYTHYWYKQREIPQDKFAGIVKDFQKVMAGITAHLPLADWDGEGEAQITDEHVRFNGRTHCGHVKDDTMSITWPMEEAGGIAAEGEEVKKGGWAAGKTIEKRVCNGDCSYESFNFPRAELNEKRNTYAHDAESGLYFGCCKTAFRPYDLAVTIFLLIAKHWLGNDIMVSSDGETAHWFDAKILCQADLGYGLEYDIKSQGELLSPGQKTFEQIKKDHQKENQLKGRAS